MNMSIEIAPWGLAVARKTKTPAKARKLKLDTIYEDEDLIQHTRKGHKSEQGSLAYVVIIMGVMLSLLFLFARHAVGGGLVVSSKQARS